MSDSKLNFKDKKVLVFGLGLLGGGVATTNWLLKQGAQVTVTDLKSAEQLKSSLEKISNDVELKLGGHSEADIDAADIIVLNQDVALNNKYVQYALSIGKPVETEGTIFFKFFPNRIVGITGTRGKTTTTSWTNTFLKTTFNSSTVGNTAAENPFLEIVDRDDLEIVASEIPSYQLEYFHLIERTPEIAVITNISPDHLNRHGTIEQYALAKANIFLKQKGDQHVIFNHNNEWTKFLIDQKPKGKVWQFSITPMSGNGLFHDNGSLFFQNDGKKHEVLLIRDFVYKRGKHNLENLLASALAAHLAGVPWDKIQDVIPKLPQIKFRQEIIYTDDKLTVINDTTATSPEGAIAAMRRFTGPNTVLIAGGTDKQLEFTEWAEAVKRNIAKGNLVLIGGSATDKMIAALGERWVDETKPAYLEDLAACVQAGLEKARELEGKAVLLFSPGCKSFEKFLNEFDRGEKFNALIREALGNAA
jgi:UDP-N-acetylmuramoylalanine--D-glutamate ligase